MRDDVEHRPRAGQARDAQPPGAQVGTDGALGELSLPRGSDNLKADDYL